MRLTERFEKQVPPLGRRGDLGRDDKNKGPTTRTSLFWAAAYAKSLVPQVRVRLLDANLGSGNGEPRAPNTTRVALSQSPLTPKAQGGT